MPALAPRDTAILQNIPLVHQVVRKISRRIPDSMDRESLVGAGMVGLIQAVDHYDSDKGVSFETYARIRIKGAVQDELRHMDYLTRDQRRVARSVSEARDTLVRERGREVDDFEVAEEADVSVETVRTATMNNTAPQSLDPAVLDETITCTPWQEDESAETELARREAVSRVRTELMRLSERDQMVMSLYYEEGLNLAEVGAILDVSQSRVSQLITKVKGTLKRRLTRTLEM
jgi:RNA polymerase sigma factor for flagellar operon FliA